MIINLRSIIFIVSIIKAVKGGCPHPLDNCSRDNIKFFLYTCVDKPPTELLLDDPKSIREAKFIEDADFKLLIHGYTQWKNAPDWLTVREEYFKEKSWNLLVVDYYPVARWGCYFDTLKPSVVKIGECIADFLKLLFKEKSKINVDRFHFVGFSMGSQICAQVSNSLKPMNMTIPRITGCDPAYPGFTSIEKKAKSILNREHAKFVDVIHSNMGNLGVVFSHAHYDIYANRGRVQPGCKFTDPSCSHNKALKIFGESINSSVKFIAEKCDSKDEWVNERKCMGDHHLKIEVGEHCKPPKTDEEMGIYRFHTNAHKPYAIPPPPPAPPAPPAPQLP